ncbi:ester cyclase [Saccharopolyspora cebuensis]|uniref:ester cyclase n=1 Tax=Saccharopolyspora cebuensis TaxID=418759 RepID=UPI0031F17C7D
MTEYLRAHHELTEVSRRLPQRFADACNRRDLDTIRTLIHPDAVHHSRLSDYPMAGIEFAFRATWSAFPDLTWTVERIIADGAWVTALMRLNGTHEGEYLGQAGTGRKVSWYSVDVARVHEGRYIEHRGIFDELYLLAQTGVVPESYLLQMS